MCPSLKCSCPFEALSVFCVLRFGESSLVVCSQFTPYNAWLTNALDDFLRRRALHIQHLCSCLAPVSQEPAKRGINRFIAIPPSNQKKNSPKVLLMSSGESAKCCA
eukprot:scaffold2738_cov314-Pinguiococcus_pyrenoidosus.AAC.7